MKLSLYDIESLGSFPHPSPSFNRDFKQLLRRTFSNGFVFRDRKHHLCVDVNPKRNEEKRFVFKNICMHVDGTFPWQKVVSCFRSNVSLLTKGTARYV